MSGDGPKPTLPRDGSAVRYQAWSGHAAPPRPLRSAPDPTRTIVLPIVRLPLLPGRRSRERTAAPHRHRHDLPLCDATGRASRDVAFDLRGALTTPKVRHRAAITNPTELGALLRAIEGYSGHPISTEIRSSVNAATVTRWMMQAKPKREEPLGKHPDARDPRCRRMETLRIWGE